MGALAALLLEMGQEADDLASLPKTYLASEQNPIGRSSSHNSPISSARIQLSPLLYKRFSQLIPTIWYSFS